MGIYGIGLEYSSRARLRRKMPSRYTCRSMSRLRGVVEAESHTGAVSPNMEGFFAQQEHLNSQVLDYCGAERVQNRHDINEIIHCSNPSSSSSSLLLQYSLLSPQTNNHIPLANRITGLQLWLDFNLLLS